MTDLIIKENSPLNDQYFLLKLTQDQPLPEMLPGQFVEILVENSSKAFLRRAISINYVDRKLNELWLLVQKVGEGTRKLAELGVGDKLNLLYPLGNSFSLPTSISSKVLLVGGGVGVAPMLMLGAYLKELGYTPNFLLGARSKYDLLELDLFHQYGTVYTTTEDGTHGETGYVTQHNLLLAQNNFEKIYTCGPTPMMKAVAAYAANRGIDCEVSLENTMACGIGACLCCVQDTNEGHKCVCTDGPVFNIKDLKW